MSRCFAGFLVIFAVISISTAFGQPAFSTTSPPVVNAASYRAPGMSASGLAPGSIFAIFGSGLGPATGVIARAFPLQTNLGGATVSITVGGTTTQAYLDYVSDSQINAILPSDTPTGSGDMTVAYGGQTSATTPVQVVAGAFGMFTAFPSGWGQAAATDLKSQQNTIIHTFHPGDYVTLWGTGLGAAPGFDAQPPTKATPVGSVTVYIGATTASNVLYHGRSGCCSGLDQVTFQIPSGVEGCYVPVGVDAGSGIGDLATIAVSNSGNTCGDSLMGQDLVNKLAAGQNVTFGYMRMISQVASGRTWETDYAYASFATYQPAYASVAEFPPSAGYCIAAPLGITDLSDLSLGFLGAGVDAGPISIVGPTGNANVTDFGGGDYGANLYGASGRFIWGGEQYTITGGGSANIGSFTINDTTNVPNVEFSNVTTDMVVPRSSDLTVKWSGGDPSKQNGNVTIGGYSWNNAFTEVESFQCVTQLSAGQFTIPQYLVGMMPETASTINAIPQGFLWIGQRNNPVVFPATPGLDLGILVDGISNGVDVFFQ